MSMQLCMSQFAIKVEHVDFVSSLKCQLSIFVQLFCLVNGKVETYGKTFPFQDNRLRIWINMF